MTPKQKVYWQRYVDYALGVMHLAHWTVRLVDDPPENDDAIASILAEEQVHDAELHLADRFFDKRPDEQRTYIAHELIHLHFWQYMQLSNELCYQLGAQAQMIAIRQLERAMELATDDLARVVRFILDEPSGPTTSNVQLE